MSSWLSGLSELTSKVQAAIPIDAETIQKLTLSTPELTAERQKIDEEERRKERVKDSLAGMYPWETQDQERDILVEECKEAIMALSGKEETFFGPYKMPKLKVDTSKKKEKDEAEEEELVDELEEERAAESEGSSKDREPTPESLEQLAKLEPLPALLGDFDLDAHVGLIQKMLEVDPVLVGRQSTLSGGGDRELTFWRNYFFHCAFTRYEAGLSVDEIWSDQPIAAANDESSQVTERSAATSVEETTITFEPKTAGDNETVTVPAEQVEQEVEAESRAPLFGSPIPLEEENPEGVENLRDGSSDYEMVGETMEDGGEMDELEAEIARELED